MTDARHVNGQKIIRIRVAIRDYWKYHEAVKNAMPHVNALIEALGNARLKKVFLQYLALFNQGHNLLVETKDLCDKLFDTYERLEKNPSAIPAEIRDQIYSKQFVQKIAAGLERLVPAFNDEQYFFDRLKTEFEIHTRHVSSEVSVELMAKFRQLKAELERKLALFKQMHTEKKLAYDLSEVEPLINEMNVLLRQGNQAAGDQNYQRVVEFYSRGLDKLDAAFEKLRAAPRRRTPTPAPHDDVEPEMPVQPGSSNRSESSESITSHPQLIKAELAQKTRAHHIVLNYLGPDSFNLTMPDLSKLRVYCMGKKDYVELINLTRDELMFGVYASRIVALGIQDLGEQVSIKVRHADEYSNPVPVRLMTRHEMTDRDVELVTELTHEALDREDADVRRLDADLKEKDLESAYDYAKSVLEYLKALAIDNEVPTATIASCGVKEYREAEEAAKSKDYKVALGKIMQFVHALKKELERRKIKVGSDVLDRITKGQMTDDEVALAKIARESIKLATSKEGRELMDELKAKMDEIKVVKELFGSLMLFVDYLSSNIPNDLRALGVEVLERDSELKRSYKSGGFESVKDDVRELIVYIIGKLAKDSYSDDDFKEYLKRKVENVDEVVEMVDGFLKNS
ncbi:hypothetical protein HN419_07225 [Candidatus Woesearchaeota archaeon]|jgi:hypothetical protein|nr:hypothetical protein [Candidatus Woesearchaeota archaeon]MBT3538284.1 hypothetical protein [Candidatus Woesearchaeota archaeon]MBT4698181.1 hypothetical protein [Candidatus Woesearchaeota archaeon]MBT4716840.1 hypothetical protein [Candidatus Woesearchaeota archaeon]MBT7105953.1 hypothetical protein [Candidatus Woesearchaeota archaeon]